MPIELKATAPAARYIPRTMRRILTLGTLLLITSTLRAAEIPDRFKPLVDTIERCERFTQLRRNEGWKELYRQGFDAMPADADLQVVSPPQANGFKMLSHVKADPTSLKFDVTPFGAGLLHVGPNVRGEFALEMRAMTVSPRLCDLSLITEAVNQSVGFQFGANDNTRNILWLGSDGERTVQKDGDNSTLIKPRTWHTVRLEVRRELVVGMVDGRVVASGKPAAKHDFRKELKPLIYLFGSAAHIDYYRVEVPDDKAAPDEIAKAWTDAFVRRTRDEVNADLAKLANELANPDYATRQAAYDLLARAGPVAKDVLRPLISTGKLESRERAKSLLRLVGESIPDETESSPAPEAPAPKQ